MTQLTSINIDRRGLMLPFGNGGDTTLTNRFVRCWHKADIPLCTAHVRYWGQSGHQVVHRTCLADIA